MNCELQEGKCFCIPDKLIKQIIKQKRAVYDLDLSCSHIFHIQNLVTLKNNLQQLSLAQNQIIEINQLSSLQGLKILDLTSNKITSMKGLEFLINLENLRLGSNLLQNIDIDISLLPTLSYLDISYNKLHSLEEISQQLSKSSVISLNVRGNLFKDYEKTFLSKCLSIQILDGYSVGQNNISNLSEMKKIIILQERQLTQKLGQEDILQGWRINLFKQLINNKSLRIQLMNCLQEIQQKYFNLIQNISEQFNKKLSVNQKSINTIKIQLNSLRSKYKNKDVTNREQLQKLSFELQSLSGQRDFVNNLQQTDLLDLTTKIRIQLEDLKKQNHDSQSACDLLKQEQSFIKLQISDYQYQLMQTKQDFEKLEQIYKNQNQEQYQINNQQKTQIKLLDDQKFQISSQLKEQKNSEDFQITSLEQKHSQEIQSLEYDNQILQQKLKNQYDEMINREQKFKQKQEDSLHMEKLQFNKIYEEVQENCTKEKQIIESTMNSTLDKTISDFRQQIKEQQKEFQQRLEHEIIAIKGDAQQFYQKEKSESIKIQEELHTEKFEQLQEFIQEEQNQKRQLTKQNSDLIRIIELKEDMIRQLQLNMKSHRDRERFQGSQQILKSEEQHYFETGQNQKIQTSIFEENTNIKNTTLKRSEELEKKALQILNSDND